MVKRDLERPTSDSAINDLGEFFAKRVKTLPQVNSIYLVEGQDDNEIWTLISAKPFDDAARTPIYKAQIEALKAFGGLTAFFRLINLKEIASKKSEVVPSKAKLVWSR